MKPRDRSEFGIAIICALPHEADPVEALFEETYDRFGTIYGKRMGDQNSYITGKLGLHNVVLCIMPGIGRGPAASVASSLRLSFTGIQLALVVGICGATPYLSGQPEIFLGDVIISDSVVQYDFGKQYPGGFERKADVTDTLGRPSQEIRALLRSLQTRRSASEFRSKTSEYLEILHKEDENWRCPVSDDILFEPSFAHKHRTGASSRPCDCFDETNTDAICKTAMGTPCATLGCDECRLIRRRSNAEGCATSIHIGKIASADTVMKSGTKRDEIAQLEKVLGFEMEGAGVWDNIPCIIIKGVCDYADSHKSKEWQNYAAAVGASAAKSFLSTWTVSLRQDSFTVQLNAQDIPRVGRFVGRTEELEELRTQLVRVSIYDRIVVLQGPPGIGKSSLVARYIEESHESYSAIFWLDASSPIHLAVSFTKARNQIEGTQQHTSPVERIQGGVSFVKDSYRRYRGKQSPGLWNAYATSEDVQFVRKWLSRKGNVHWLLAFDNYCPPGPEENDQDPLIKAFLPEKPQGHMVITTFTSPNGANHSS
ncbi:unnamed protein product [Penicillium olsonii]|nr:unnamed protein product [Penicillium olsonii]